METQSNDYFDLVRRKSEEEFQVIFATTKALDFSNQKLNTLPAMVGKFRNLKILKLNENHFTHLPDIIQQLTQLEELYLYANYLTDLPLFLEKLPHLKVIDLSLNQFDKLPSVLFKLKDLRELAMGSNQFTTLPDTIGQLTSLRCLHLNHRGTIKDRLVGGDVSGYPKILYEGKPLEALPKSLGQLHHLQLLDLGRNSLQVLPNELSNLKKLRILCLDDNQFTSFPKIIHKLRNLLVLTLAGNQLISLSELSIEGLNPYLEALDLSRNQLEVLPSAIGNLRYLSVLDISYNQIRTFPDSLEKLQHQEISLITVIFRAFIFRCFLHRRDIPEKWNPGFNKSKAKKSQLIRSEIHHLLMDICVSGPARKYSLDKMDISSNPLDTVEIAKLEKMLPHCRVDNYRVRSWRGNLPASDDLQ